VGLTCGYRIVCTGRVPDGGGRWLSCGFRELETVSIPVSSSKFFDRARLAQRESASLTRKRSLVQSQYRAQQFQLLKVST
jgi:hypothetical protein